MRRYEEPVEVRPESRSGEGGDRPGAFLWRGRVYVVRAVLGHWRERRAWWTESAARAVHGEEPADTRPTKAGSAVRPAGLTSLADEHEVWRVEAGAGRQSGLGVYDLRHEVGSTWSLVRVGD